VRIFILLLLFFFSSSSFADLRELEKKVELSNKRNNSSPTTTPSPSPTPYYSGELNNLDDSSCGWLCGLITLFSGPGSAVQPSSLNGETSAASSGQFKGDLFAHGLAGPESTSGYQLGAEARFMRLYLLADFEQLRQNSFTLDSTRLRLGYSFGFDSQAIFGYLGTYQLKGDFDNTGATLGLGWNWYISDHLRSELTFDSTGFGESSLRQMNATLQYRLTSFLFADTGVRYTYLTRTELDYTLYFVGLRFNIEE
jgi:hypothetical protein